MGFVKEDVKCLQWSLEAHSKPVTSLSFNGDESMGIFASGSMDKRIRIWQQASAGACPVLLSEQSNKAQGAIFSLDFAPKRLVPTMLVIGGAQNFGVWDILSDPKIKNFYEGGKKGGDGGDDGAEGVKFQHRIMEQTFNYKEDEKIVIRDDEPIGDFLEDE